MAFQIKAKYELDANGLFIWATDLTGEYDLTTNPTGWGDGGDGSGNRNLNESAFIGVGIVNNNPVRLLTLDNDQQVKYSASFTNDDQLMFQFDYVNDGYHSMRLFRLFVSGDDLVSLDTFNPVNFIQGDVWYNTVEQVVKYSSSAGVVLLDLTNIDDINILIEAQNIDSLLCEDMFYTQLSIEKQNRYLDKRNARANDNTEQENELSKNINDILLNIAGADYNFRGGLKNEAHNIVESTLDDYVR